MLKRLINIISIIFVYSVCCIYIYNSNINTPIKNFSYNTPTNVNKAYKKENILATIKIDKININHPLYNLSDPKNNVEENITILEGSILPDKDNSIMFIAAHSGTGKIAYFNNLDKLVKGDIVSFFYKNKEYKYVVTTIYEEDKNGYIHVSKEKSKQLVLTTCSKNKKKQLIVNCIEKRTF